MQNNVIYITLEWEYVHLDNTHGDNNGPFIKNLISVTDSNITTVPNYEINIHTSETSLTETISTIYSSRLRKTPISRKDVFYGKNVWLKS